MTVHPVDLTKNWDLVNWGIAMVKRILDADWLLLLAVGQLDIAAVSMASTYRWTYDPIQLYMI